MESQAAQQEQARDEGGQATTQVARTLEGKYLYMYHMSDSPTSPTEELTQECLANAELQKALDDMVKSGGTSTNAEGPTIPRPKGSAGTHFSIQVEMKLASSQEKDLKYKAIQVRCKIPESQRKDITDSQLISQARNPFPCSQCQYRLEVNLVQNSGTSKGQSI